MNWISICDSLPEEGVYVLCLADDGDVGVYEMRRGISIVEREAMKSGAIEDPLHGPNWCLSEGFTFTKRSMIYTSDDEWGNNLAPFSFHAKSGPMHLFGQEVTHCAHIATPTARTTLPTNAQA